MEIAVVMLDGTVAFHSLVNPGIPIPQFVAGLTGIDAKMVRHAPTFDAIVEQLLAALEGCVFVAHNARFDWAFVSTEIERATGLLLQGPRVCTVRLARKVLGAFVEIGAGEWGDNVVGFDLPRGAAAGSAELTRSSRCPG